jgi:hypothetical protein
MRDSRLSPEHVLLGTANVTIGDFWSWAYSDILDNRNRSVFAEFLVGTALGVVNVPRIEWDAVDLKYHDKSVEVKSAAYLQTWQQKALSTIRFDIGKKKSWYAETNTYAEERIRSADCYVFCVYTDTDPVTADVLDVRRWVFHVLSTSKIEEVFGNQKKVGLARIRKLCDGVGFSALKQAVESALRS